MAIVNDMVNDMDTNVQHIARGLQAQRVITDRMGWTDTQVIVEHVLDIATSVSEQATLFIMLANMPDQALDDLVDCSCTPNRECRSCTMRQRSLAGLSIPALD